jgi:hypothetical protein
VNGGLLGDWAAGPFGGATKYVSARTILSNSRTARLQQPSSLQSCNETHSRAMIWLRDVIEWIVP